MTVKCVASALMILTFLMPGLPALSAEELKISVAASMTDVFRELSSKFLESSPGYRILPNFGPSGGLAKQIEQGAPADIYVSANPKWMEFLAERGRIARGSRKVFAYNSLVFVGRKNEHITSLDDLLSLDRIAIGSPDSVPAGQYARQALRRAGLYDRLLADGKLVMAKDVRQALIYADRGEIDGSFVYRTDAMLATKAVILLEVPPDLYDRVTCPIALTNEGANKAGARKFFSYITSREAGEVLQKYGFILPRK